MPLASSMQTGRQIRKMVDDIAKFFTHKATIGRKAISFLMLIAWNSMTDISASKVPIHAPRLPMMGMRIKFARRFNKAPSITE